MSIHFTFTLLRYWNISVNRRKYKIKNNSFHELNHSKIWQQIITKPTLAIKATKFSFVSNASQFIRPLNHGYFVSRMGWKKLFCLVNQKCQCSLVTNHGWFKTHYWLPTVLKNLLFSMFFTKVCCKKSIWWCKYDIYNP